MTIDAQLRDLARRADQHQQVITAAEVLQRAAARRTRTNSRLRDPNEMVHQMPTGLTEEEVAMIDLETSSHDTEHRKRPRPILLGCVAAAAVLAVIALVAIQAGDGAETPPGAGDGPRILAKATDVKFIGTEGLDNQTLSVTAEEQDGIVTGQFRISENVINIECADTSTDGFVILGGAAVSGPNVAKGDLLGLVIREGNPDAAALFGGQGASSCTELLSSMPADQLTNESNFSIVRDGYDIVTG